MTHPIETKTVTLIEYIHLPQHIQDLIEVKGQSTFQEFYIDFNSMEELEQAYKDDQKNNSKILTFDEWLDHYSGTRLEYEMRKEYPTKKFTTDVTSYIMIDW